MYSIAVRDHIMIAHSFRGAVFGPARALHGATFVVDVELRRARLDPDGLVVDISRLTSCLKTVLADLNYRNLDQLGAFAGVNTTSEWLAGEIHRRMRARIVAGELGPGAWPGLSTMKVTLHESHVAWAAFEGPIDDG